MIVLDTSAVSGIMHRDPAALVRLSAYRPLDVLLCSPVASEVAYGLARLVRGSRRRTLLETEYRALRSVVAWSDWTEAAAQRFGDVKAELIGRGRTIDDMDIVIASVALVRGLRVATRNVKHFEQVRGLAVEDWSATE